MPTVFAALFHAIRYAVVAIGALVLLSLLFAYGTKLYPVAIVGGAPVWMRTWNQMIGAAEQYTNTEREARGERPYNFSFSENAGIAREIRTRTLTALIEDKIILKEGSNYIDGFGSLTGEEVQKILSASTRDPNDIAKNVYGMTLDEYKALILAPQARRSALSGALRARGRTLEDWLIEMKIKKSVRIYFMPYRWNGKTVE